jgi:hypothetical protein
MRIFYMLDKFFTYAIIINGVFRQGIAFMQASANHDCLTVFLVRKRIAQFLAETR